MKRVRLNAKGQRPNNFTGQITWFYDEGFTEKVEFFLAGRLVNERAFWEVVLEISLKAADDSFCGYRLKNV